MKCEKCNEKEATFYYSSNINGEKTERHLCNPCAREEGFGSALDYQPMTGFGGMFDSLFADFFSPRRSLLSAFDMLDRPMRRMMTAALPQIHIVVGQPQSQQPASETEQKIPEDAGEEVKARREIDALKHQLQEAVNAENYEKAIELRDQLQALENSEN